MNVFGHEDKLLTQLKSIGYSGALDDMKKQFYMDALGYNSDINTLERDWLESLITSTASALAFDLAGDLGGGADGDYTGALEDFWHIVLSQNSLDSYTYWQLYVLYILHLVDSIDTVSSVPLSCSINGIRYGTVDGALYEFAIDEVPIEDDGLRGCPAFTQYFLNNEAPVTQTITLPAGNYTMWIEGTGSVTYDGNTATEASPVYFTSAGTTLSAVVTGSVDKVMLTSGGFIAPFTPTAESTVSVVTEAGTCSFDLDIMSKALPVLRGPNAQGCIELVFKANFNSDDLPLVNYTDITLFTVSNAVFRGSVGFRKYASGAFRIVAVDDSYQGTYVSTTIHRGDELNIVVNFGDYEGTPGLQISVNGVDGTVSAFSGSFGTRDMVFMYANTIHAGWIMDGSLKIWPAPKW